MICILPVLLFFCQALDGQQTRKIHALDGKGASSSAPPTAPFKRPVLSPNTIMLSPTYITKEGEFGQQSQKALPNRHQDYRIEIDVRAFTFQMDQRVSFFTTTANAKFILLLTDHEIGHLVANIMCPDGFKFLNITINGNNNTAFTFHELPSHFTNEQLLCLIHLKMGGPANEKIVNNKITGDILDRLQAKQAAFTYLKNKHSNIKTRLLYYNESNESVATQNEVSDFVETIFCQVVQKMSSIEVRGVCEELRKLIYRKRVVYDVDVDPYLAGINVVKPRDGNQAYSGQGHPFGQSFYFWAMQKVSENLPPPDLKQVLGQRSIYESCKDQQLCVIVFFTHIMDCKSKWQNDNLTMLHALALIEKFKRNHWCWVWTEAGQQPDLEHSFGIGGFGYKPAMVAVNTRKLKYSTMTGSFGQSGIAEFLHDFSYGKGKTSSVPGASMPSQADVPACDGRDAELPLMEEVDDEEEEEMPTKEAKKGVDEEEKKKKGTKAEEQASAKKTKTPKKKSADEL